MSLSEAEHRAMELTAELVNLFSRQIVSNGHTRSGDVTEFALHIHAIQHTIMAQSAARQHPERYRLLGGVVSPSLPVGDVPPPATED